MKTVVKSRIKRAFSLFPSLLLVLLNTFYLLLPSPVLAASSPWTQTDWSGGSGQTAWSDATKFDSSSSVTTSTAGQVTLSATSSWYNTSWAYRRKITFDNSAQAENLANFPVLVKLDSTRINYSNTQNSGQDIRFTDSDGTTLLSYEIEKWDETGNSFVWVKVPQVDASSATDNIYMYYGNSSATDGQAATSVWDSNNKGVWHLPNGTTLTANDSTSNINNGTISGATAGTGQVDGAGSFNGTTNKINVTDSGSSSLDMSSSVTASVWIKRGASTGNYAETIVSKRSAAPNDAESNYQFYLAATLNRNTRFYNGTAEYEVSYTPPVGEWVQLVFIVDGGQFKVYANGVFQGQIATSLGAVNNGDFWIGFFDHSGVDEPFNGLIDEVRISSTARSAAWIAASYKSEADTLNTFASEESVYSTTPGTLTSSIFDTEFSAGAAWGTLTYNATTPTNTSISVKARTSNSSAMTGATAFSSCTAITSGSDISSNSCVTDSHRYIQYQITAANTDSVSTPTFQDVSVAFEVFIPAAPSSLSGTPATSDGTTKITWSWTDNASNEDGFYVQTTGGTTVCTVSSSNTTTCTETGLTPNTSYTRRVVAYNAGGNSSASANASATTRSLASPTLDSPAASSYTVGSRPSFKFKTPTDDTSTSKYTDVSSYKLTVKDSGGTGYITITGIPKDRTTTYTASTYEATYSGFSDSDITNNYITVVTKSSSSWSSTANDGSLKEGKNTWGVASVDAGGNESAGERILYYDTTLPNLTASLANQGENEEYLMVETRKPHIFGNVTDNINIDKIVVTFVKETGVLGVTISESVFDEETLFRGANGSATDWDYDFQASNNLDFGRYRIKISAYDKAENSKSASFLAQILTQDKINQILADQGKKSAKEGAGQISLPALEKKALVRRQKEAEELNKFLEVSINIGRKFAGTFFSKLEEIGISITSFNFSVREKIQEKTIALFSNITPISLPQLPGISPLADSSQELADNLVNNRAKEFKDNLNLSVKNFVRQQVPLTKGLISSVENLGQDALNSYEEGRAKSITRVREIWQGEKLVGAVDLVLREVKNPVVETGGFINRVKIGASTFVAIVFDKEPTAISGVTIQEVGDDWATVSWETNHYATGKVNYGETLAYGKEVFLPGRDKHHQAKLTNLAKGQKYFFEVMSQNKNYAYDAYYVIEMPK